MTNKTQLPKEVALSLKRVARWVKEGSLSAEYGVGYKEGIDIMEKEYAKKPHEVQGQIQEAVKALQVSDKERKDANNELREAKKLLNEVFRKHESGLLPDRFIYEKIKRFLYGE